MNAQQLDDINITTQIISRSPVTIAESFWLAIILRRNHIIINSVQAMFKLT